jgi:hypothetical protein
MPSQINDNDKDRIMMEEMREREAEDLASILAKKYSLPYLDLSRMTIDLDALKLVSEKDSKEARLVVFQKAGQKIQIAIQSPNPPKTREILKNLESRGFKVALYMVSENSLERAWKRYAEMASYLEAPQGIVEVSPSKLKEFMDKAKTMKFFLMRPLNPSKGEECRKFWK